MLWCCYLLRKLRVCFPDRHCRSQNITSVAKTEDDPTSTEHKVLCCFVTVTVYLLLSEIIAVRHDVTTVLRFKYESRIYCVEGEHRAVAQSKKLAQLLWTSDSI